MTPAVSVIVPVYNVEAYLPHCLDSLCRQSLSEIEIIVIDDASPDRCGIICDDYAEKNPRIKVFHQPENLGTAAARNLGIQYATGKYLMFVDGDDWVSEEYCQAAYDCAETHQVDLVMFNYARVSLRGDQQKVFGDFAEGYKTKEEALDMILVDGGNSPTNKICRKELFDGISYPEGFVYEETGATYKLVFKATRFYFMDKTLYFYNQRPGSITHSKVTQKELSDRAKLNTQRYRDLKAWGFDSEMLEYRFLSFALWYCAHQKRDMSNPEYVTLAQALQTCRKAPSLFSFKEKTVLYVYKCCPWLLELLYTLMGKKVR